MARTKQTTKQMKVDNKLNEFVRQFLIDFCEEDALEEWMDEERQEAFNALIASLTPKPAKAAKKPKDPNRPTKPMNVYQLFSRDERKVLKEENPELDNKEVMKELGVRWETFKEEEGDSERMKGYQAEYDQAKEEYDEAMKDYVPAEGVEAPKKAKAAKKAGDGPKRSPTAYALFSKDEREKIKEEGEITGRDVMGELGRRWAQLKEDDPDEHKRYEEMAKEAKAEFEANKPDSDEGPSEKPKKAAAKGKAAKKEEPPKKTGSAFMTYCKKKRVELRGENPDATPGEISTMLRESWGEMDEEERAEYA